MSIKLLVVLLLDLPFASFGFDALFNRRSILASMVASTVSITEQDFTQMLGPATEDHPQIMLPDIAVQKPIIEGG